jgi:hypothetical protein
MLGEQIGDIAAICVASEGLAHNGTHERALETLLQI